ncbi:DedA family protein [Nocardiopsis algeriensis]|uniref:Membrane protein DedA with SNARE-associated domain n=1 Tax=Nocardiopsis algeriensis TaxID=1478215 RepID=A0A841IUT1_9ACTN|nr:VTT domain-containing protein [Nocardiopsis algeriensis]MBB6120305.1 membrane protein DedA with SNARE-associated domain [Nocardiopsis algeriensis]
MPQFAFLEGQPFWIIYFTLLFVISLRAPATYWLGRGLGAGVTRSRIGKRIGPRLTRAEDLINRYGAPVITLSFLTVGMQSAVNLAAGVVRMRFPKYMAAMFVGGLMWAGLWGLVIAGAVGAWLTLFLNSPWTAAAVVAVAGALVAAMAVRSRRRAARRAAEAGEDGHGSAGETVEAGSETAAA